MGEIFTERCTYQSETGEVGGYLARPADGAPWPAVVVIHDRYGLWEHIEETAREFAEAGYVALAPDLNWRDPVRRALADDDVHDGGKVVSSPDQFPLAAFPLERQAGIQAGADWLRNRNAATHVPDTLAGIAYLKARPDVRAGAVGAFGYCMGGRVVASVVGTGADIGAAVIYYGIFTDPEKQAPQVRCPIQGHYGATDEGVNKTIPATVTAMQANGKDYTPFIYEGAGHAFADRFSEMSSRPEVTRQAWDRSIQFLDRHLKRVPTPAR